MMKMKAKIEKFGNSYGVLLSEEILGIASFSENEEIELLTDETGINIRKSVRVDTLAELFANYDGTNSGKEIDYGKPVGKEVW